LLRRMTALIGTVVASAALLLAGQSPAAAWTDYVSASTTYYTHGGSLFIYADAQGNNWGCSGLGLLMDCADGQNVYGMVSADNTSPDAVQVQTSISFSGVALSVGLPAGAGGSASGTTCTQPAFSSGGSFVSATSYGVQCHAQTVATVTGMTLWVNGWGRWGCCWYGGSASGFLDMYPR